MGNAIIERSPVIPGVPGTIDLVERRPGIRDIGRTMRVTALLRRHRIPMLLLLIASAMVTATATWFQTPLFRATTTLEVEGRNPNFLNNKDFEPSGSSRSGEAFMATQTKLIRTETLAERVAKRTNLAHNEAFFRESPAKVFFHKLLNSSESPRAASDSEIIQQLLGRISVKPEGDSDLITITVDTPDPVLSAQLANRLSAEFVSAEQEERWDRAVRVGKWLTEQLGDFRSKLQTSEDDLQRYAQGAGLLFTTDDRNNVADDRLRQIQQELSRTQADRAEKQSQMEMLSSSSLDSLPRVLDDGPTRDLTVKLADLRTQDANLSATMTPTHYRVQRIRAEMAAVERELSQRRATVLARIQNEYGAVLKREKLLQTSFDTQSRFVSSQNARAARYNVLKREVETNRQLYGSMLQKVKEASVLSALKTNSLRVVDPARVPERRYRPSLVQNTGLGLLAFGLGSVLLVLFRERTDRSIRDPGEATRLQFRELGVIPSARYDPQVRMLFQESDGKQSNSSGARLLGDKAAASTGLDLRLVTRTHSHSLLADAFRSAALSIVQPSDGKLSPKIVSFTSPNKQAGKSTTAANLAIAMADRNRTVLLIDGDLRRPQVHSLFGLSLGPGLIDLLKEDRSSSEGDVTDLTRPTPVTNLRIITAGQDDELDPMILGSDRFHRLLEELRSRYDVILIDSPPLMHLPDARLIAKQADGLVLVVRAGKTSMDEVSDASQVLWNDGTHVLGVILNDWDPRSVSPGYYSSYYSS